MKRFGFELVAISSGYEEFMKFWTTDGCLLVSNGSAHEDPQQCDSPSNEIVEANMVSGFGLC